LSRPTWTPTATGLVVAALLALCALPQARAQELRDPVQSLRDAMDLLGFDEGDFERVLAGKIVAHRIEARGEKELAIAAAMLMPNIPPRRVAEKMLKGRLLDVSHVVLEWGGLPEDPNVGDICCITIAPSDDREMKALRRASPGDKLNLSRDEIERLQGVAGQAGSDAEVEEALVLAYREILRERYRAYRQSGARTAAPYERGPGRNAVPAQELALAADESEFMKEHLPVFWRAMAGYPSDQDPAIEHRFRWIKQLVGGRPAFILSHVMVLPGDRYCLGAERQFYVGHTFNSQQTLGGAVAVDEGTLILYVNRTFTDKVTGMAAGLKRKIGARKVRAAIVRFLGDIRAEIERQ